MIKWFLYVVLLMVFLPRRSYPKDNLGASVSIFYTYQYFQQRDTSTVKNARRSQDDDKKKVKEVARARKMPKPEKLEEIDPTTGKPKNKPARLRRPEGLERPPEIPRRNGN